MHRRHVAGLRGLMPVRIGVVPEHRLLDRVGSERVRSRSPRGERPSTRPWSLPDSALWQPAPVREEAPEAFWLATGASVLEQGIARVRRGAATSADCDSTPVAAGNFCPDRATRW